MKNIVLLAIVQLFVINVFSQVVVTGETGRLTLTTQEYVNNYTKQFNINSGVLKPIELHINIDIEPDYDFVYIYECDDSFANQIQVAALSGKQVTTYTSSKANGKLIVKFVTDNSVCGSDRGYAGFVIDYNTISASDVPTRNTFSENGQVIFGQSVISNLKIIDYESKVFLDHSSLTPDYNKAMILLESDYGKKLGLSYNGVSTNGNLGIQAKGQLIHKANEYTFSTVLNENALRITDWGKLILNNSEKTNGRINVKLDGGRWETLFEACDALGNYQFHIGNGGQEFGKSYFPVISGKTIDNVPGIELLGDHHGENTNGRGIVVIEGRSKGKSAQANQVVLEVCSGYGNRIAHITGEGSFYAKKDIVANGTIKATEIKVEAQTADFVFEDDYLLKDLSEVEAFIKANKHLPEIPSALEMEETGVNLAEMNKLLLMKVEELTLYAIEKDKEVSQLKSDVEEKSQQLNSVELRLEAIEEMLLNK